MRTTIPTTLRVTRRFGLPQLDDVFTTLLEGPQGELYRQDGTSACVSRQLIINFEALKFADIKALAALVLATGAFGKDCDEIILVPPKYENAASFIRYSRFKEALEETPGAQFRVTGEASRADQRYANIVPLTWVTTNNDLATFVTSVLSHAVGEQKTTRMRPIDVEALTRVFLIELLENVNSHSNSIGALMTAWAERGTRWAAKTDYFSGERGYYDRFHDGRLGQLHLFIGDRGVGIPATLREGVSDETDFDVMMRSLDKWSTSRPRADIDGTRGLYQVSRIASRYRGLLTLRCGRTILTRSFEGFDGTDGAKSDGAYSAPGTQIRIELPLHYDQTRPLLPDPESIPDLQMAHVPVSMHDSQEVVSAAIQSARRSVPHAILVELDDAGDSKVAQNALIRFLVMMTESSGSERIALVIGGVNDVVLGQVCDEARVEIEASYQLGIAQSMSTEVDPLLVIGSSFGASHWIANVEALDEIRLLEANTWSLAPMQIEGSRIGFHDAETGRWRLLLTPGNLLTFARKTLDVEMKSARHARRLSEGGSYVGSALQETPVWVNIVGAIEEFSLGYGVLARLLTTVIEQGPFNHPSLPPSIVYDQSFPDELADKVSELLHGGNRTTNVCQKVRKHDIEVARELGLDPDRSVIVLTAGMLSGETARNLLSVSLRQQRDVYVVASVLDMRGIPGESIALWNRDYPCVSVVVLPTKTSKITRRFHVDERGKRIRKKKNLTVQAPELEANRSVELLSGAGAIKLGHYAGSVDRHFTFYIDSRRALNNAAFESTMLGPMFERAEAWCRSAQRQTFWVTYPNPELRADSPAATIADTLVSYLKYRGFNAIVVGSDDRGKSLGPAVISVAWGSVSGASFLQTLQDNLELQTETLLVLTLFSQLPDFLEKHLLTLTQLNDTSPLKVQTWFGSTLPVEAYPQESCPVCRQIQARGGWVQLNEPTKYLEEEYRLAVVPWSLAGHTTPVGPTRRVAANALRLRLDLVAASNDRYAAMQIRTQLTVWDHLAPDFLALIALLAFEPQWLRRVPLDNQSGRSALAALCLRLATDSSAPMDQRVNGLIALRLTSKHAFASNIEWLGLRLTDYPDLYDLFIYLGGTILAKEYVAFTGLPALMTDELVNLERKISSLIASDPPQVGPRQGYGLRRGLDRLIGRSLEMRIRADNTQASHYEIIERLPRLLELKHGHRLLEPLTTIENTPEITGENIHLLLESWFSVSAWVRSNAHPTINRVKRTLLGTLAFEDRTDFEMVFGAQENANSLAAFVFRLGQAANSQMPVAGLRTLSKDAVDLVAALKNLLGSASGGVNALTSAAQQVACSPAEFAILLAAEIRKVGAKVSFGQKAPDQSQLLLPTLWRRELARNLAINMTKSPSPTARLKVDSFANPGIGRGRFLYEFRSFGTRDVGEGSRTPQGGLNECLDTAPEDVRMDFYPSYDGTTGVPVFYVRVDTALLF